MQICALSETGGALTTPTCTSFVLTLIAKRYYTDHAKNQRLLIRHYVYPALVRIARNAVNFRPISSLTDFTGIGPSTGWNQGSGFIRPTLPPGGQDTFEVEPYVDYNSTREVLQPGEFEPEIDVFDSRVDQFGDPFKGEVSDPFREAEKR